MTIARLKLKLDHVEPKVVRVLEVPLDIRLDDLDQVLQRSMPWDSTHLWEFRAAKQRFGPKFDDPFGWDEGPADATKSTLGELFALTDGKPFKYLYDFGDGWEHVVKLDKIVEPEPGVAYPRLIAAEGRCPPEDIGGPWGYAEFLEAICDPDHERHDELVEWHGAACGVGGAAARKPRDLFDPTVVDLPTLQRAVAAIGLRKPRKKAVAAKSTARTAKPKSARAVAK